MKDRILKSEIPAAKRIPYRSLASENTIITEAGEYMQVIRLSGASYESADDEEINNWHNRLNVLYRNIGSPHIMLYQHIVRREENSYPDAQFEEGSFAADLDAAYQKKLAEDMLMVNELYLTVMYKPLTSILTQKLFEMVQTTAKSKGNALSAISLWCLSLLGITAKGIESSILEEQKLAEETLTKTVETMLMSLDRYDPELLGTYTYITREYKYTCSEVLEFFGYLINGEWQRYPLPHGPVNEYLATSRQLFGTESFELWTPTGKKICGAVLGIKEPPAETSPGFLDHVLTLPFPYVITQSFDFQFKESAKSKIKMQRDRLKTSNDDAISQQEGLAQALDDVTSNVYLYGDHHFNMIVYGANARDVNNNLSIARSSLADAGMVISREDAANEAAFWAQLPGNAALRPRVAAINSRNFAAFAPYHNFPRGRKENNHWGPALTMFKTSAGSPYYFSYHASDPYDPDGGSKKDVGHALILGPSGTGKTALSCFTQTMLEKFDCTRVCFTKDYDAQLCIQANGGIFFPIKQGIPTGFNPFAVDPTPENRTFVYGLLREMLKMPGREFSPTEEEELSRSLGILWNMPQEVRRLARLKDSLRVTQEDGLHKRLRKWVESGEYAWVFDNLQDGMQDIFTTHKYIGFDVTSFLDIPTIRTPINMYLFNWVNRLTDGRRFALYISEFWKILDDPAMEYFAKDQLKTQRKKNAFTVLDSQSPSDVFNSSASRTLIEQTPTKFLLPNPDANKEEYIDGLNCSEREVRIIKEEMEPGSRQFLIKQGRQSVVCELNLKGMYYYLHILSSRTQNIEIAAALQAQFGIEPGQWLPVFRQRVAA